MIETNPQKPNRRLYRLSRFLQRKMAWIFIISVALVIGGINLMPPRTLPKDPNERLEALLRAKMLVEAEAVYQDLLASDPQNLELHYRHIRNHFDIPAVKNGGEADEEFIRYYSDLAAKPETRDVGLFALGLIQAREKNFKQALVYYRQVFNRDLKYLNLATGKAYLELENEVLAEGFFRREVQAEGDFSGAVSGLLSIYIKNNQIEKLQALNDDSRLAPFIELKYQRKLALRAGEMSTYLRYTFLSPMQRLSFDAVLCSLLICAIWFTYLRRIDIFAEKPMFLSIAMLGAGAGSALVSLIFSDSLNEFLPLSMGQGWYKDLIFSILHIGVVEEAAKFLPVLLILPLTRRSKEPFDLVFFASLSALGFATLENAFYFSRYGIGISASRFVFSTIMHLSMTGIVAYAVVRARYILPKKILPALLSGLVAGALVHGLFDFFLLGPLTRFSGISIFVLLLAAREYYRMIRTTLNLSPFFDEARSISPRLTNFGLLFSSTAALFLLVFLFHNYASSTEIANKQLSSLVLISSPAILAVYTSLGRLQLNRGQLVPFFRVPFLKRNKPLEEVDRWWANPTAKVIH